jgi:hypothetical protein
LTGDGLGRDRAVTLESIVRERHLRWADALYRHGYIVEAHPRPTTSALLGTVGLRGRRRADLGVPEVVIDIAEKWVNGADPDGLGLEQHSCHLASSSWHAQLEPGEAGAERLDVDRFKPAGLTIHRHPLGSPNDERTPERAVPAPEAWVTQIETLSADLYFRKTKPTK